jgi:hypothetical protein
VLDGYLRKTQELVPVPVVRLIELKRVLQLKTSVPPDALRLIGERRRWKREFTKLALVDSSKSFTGAWNLLLRFREATSHSVRAVLHQDRTWDRPHFP